MPSQAARDFTLTQVSLTPFPLLPIIKAKGCVTRLVPHAYTFTLLIDTPTALLFFMRQVTEFLSFAAGTISLVITPTLDP